MTSRIFLFALFSLFIFPSVSSAQVSTIRAVVNEQQQIDALVAQIADLLALVSSLQEQLLAQNGGNTITSSASVAMTLTRNLTVGDEGADVKVLQQFLNTDSRTSVASSGVGSLGNETNYFGRLTTQAVIRFQELYRNDILTPVGLTEGSGFVGPSTRAKINALGSSVGSNTTSSNTPLVEALSITVTSPPVINTESATLTIELPTSVGANLPEVYAISPSIGYLDTEVTIYGSGFTSTNNTAEFGLDFGSVIGIASNDGTTLQFTVNPDLGIEHREGLLQEWPVFIRIINANGTSVDFATFVITI